MSKPAPLGRDPGFSSTCGHCGWQGPEVMTGVSEPLGDPLGAECPRCSAPVSAEMPSIDEIAAARRAPEAD